MLFGWPVGMSLTNLTCNGDVPIYHRQTNRARRPMNRVRKTALMTRSINNVQKIKVRFELFIHNFNFWIFVPRCTGHLWKSPPFFRLSSPWIVGWHHANDIVGIMPIASLASCQWHVSHQPVLCRILPQYPSWAVSILCHYFSQLFLLSVSITCNSLYFCYFSTVFKTDFVRLCRGAPDAWGIDLVPTPEGHNHCLPTPDPVHTIATVWTIRGLSCHRSSPHCQDLTRRAGCAFQCHWWLGALRVISRMDRRCDHPSTPMSLSGQPDCLSAMHIDDIFNWIVRYHAWWLSLTFSRLMYFTAITKKFWL